MAEFLKAYEEKCAAQGVSDPGAVPTASLTMRVHSTVRKAMGRVKCVDRELTHQELLEELGSVRKTQRLPRVRSNNGTASWRRRRKKTKYS